MIIDAHAHLTTQDYGQAEAYLKALADAGIDGGVVVPGGMLDVRRMTDYITGKTQPENPVPNNDYLFQSLQDHDAVVAAFACVDPHRPNAVQHLAELLDKGFGGLKLSPISHQFSFAGKVLAELAALCGERNVPVYSHVLYSPGANTTRFITLAKQFPQTNFILGHMGFGPADQEGLEAAAQLDNFFLETSTGSFLHIQEVVRRAGASKLLFGSEFPLSHPTVELQKIMLLDVSDDGRDQILGGTIQALLGSKKGADGHDGGSPAQSAQ